MTDRNGRPTVKRCALYTRKSSDEGLEQAFNSLDAQREACAAYVKSQSGEGWRTLPARYDDGGASGGTMARPALQMLLADITAGRVDIVVVYKIDRLTRSLADFARMVEIFERHDVSFVSVTQSFNTTSSMGRLTLNVLLSFAQFEREITGERIRDKIAASKEKGLWMGGNPPLGYDLPNDGSRVLIVNAPEADVVRRIFTLYRQMGSAHALQQHLESERILSKQWVTASGREVGGKPFSRGALFHLLRNRLYIGEIRHRDLFHPGQHAAIVDRDLFDAVQDQITTQARRSRATRDSVASSPLAGRIFDADGNPMSPTFAYGKQKRLYRYYVSAPLQQGGRRRQNDTKPRRVSAERLEARLSSALLRLLPNQDGLSLDAVHRVEVHTDHIDVSLPIGFLRRLRENLIAGEKAERDPADPSHLRLILPGHIASRGAHIDVEAGAPGAPRPDATLIRALRSAHAMLDSSGGTPELHAAPTSPYRRRLVRLAFLAPDLQRAILDGRQPPGLTLAAVMDGELPLSWAAQIQRFGAPGEAV